METTSSHESYRTRDRTWVVAEIGNNHEGDFNVACELVRQAARCGVDAVKFQTFQTEWFVSPMDTERVERMRRFELSPDQFAGLCELSHALGLDFISTPLDLPSVKVLSPLVDAFKIASGDNNFYPMIDALCQSGKPIIMSSGVSDLEQIKASTSFVQAAWNRHGKASDLVVLHCVSNYPTQPADANLRSIEHLKSELAFEIGYSDHTLGIDACLLAVGLGASVIEKHFTLDKRFSDFRDHAIAADPDEMSQLVSCIRNAEAMLGDGRKRLADCEVEMARAIRRSIVAARQLPIGHKITDCDLTWMRPGSGLAPGQEHQLIGTTLKRPVARGEAFDQRDVA